MSRRWRYPRSRRGSFFPRVPTQATPAAPAYIPAFQEPAGRNAKARTTRRGQFWRVIATAAVQVAQYVPAFQEPAGRNSRPRLKPRGRFFPVVPAPVVQVAAFVPSVMEPGGRNARPRTTRRGTFYFAPPAPIAAVAVWVPSFTNARRAPVRPVRRGEFQTVLPPVVLAGPGPCPPNLLRPSTRRLAAPRRGQFLTVPKVGAAPLTPPVPTFTRPRVRGGLARRGEFFAFPLVGAAPAPSVALPQMIRSRVRVLFTRRSRFWTPVPQQTISTSSWVPQIARVRRPQVSPVRHGEYLTVPLPRATCPVRMAPRRRNLPAVRRGHVFGPTWVYVPPPPPTSGTAHAATGLVPTASAVAVTTASASAAVMTVPTATGG